MIESIELIDRIENATKTKGCYRVKPELALELFETFRALREVAKAAQGYLAIRNLSTDETVRVDGRRAIERRLMELPPELLR